MRLKLTVAYDGTGFRGWARSRASATVEGELRARARAASTGRYERSRRRRTHRHRRARARERRLGRRATAGRRQDARPEALNAVLPDDLAVMRGRRGAGRLPRARSARARGRIATASGGAASARPFEVDRVALASAARSICERLNAVGCDAGRRARLPRVHADARRSIEAFVTRARGCAGSSADDEPGRSSRSPPTRSSATWCGRSSARCSSAIRRPRRLLAGAPRTRIDRPAAVPQRRYLTAVA